MGQYLSNKFEILENKKNIISLNEYNYQKNILIKEEDMLQKKFYSQRIDLDNQFNDVNKILENYLKKIVEEISINNEIKVIFNKSITLFIEESLDITNIVIDKLNKKMKFIEIN